MSIYLGYNEVASRHFQNNFPTSRLFREFFQLLVLESASLLRFQVKVKFSLYVPGVA